MLIYTLHNIMDYAKTILQYTFCSLLVQKTHINKIYNNIVRRGFYVKTYQYRYILQTADKCADTWLWIQLTGIYNFVSKTILSYIAILPKSVLLNPNLPIFLQVNVLKGHTVGQYLYWNNRSVVIHLINTWFWHLLHSRGDKFLELPYVVKGMDVSFSGLLSFIEVCLEFALCFPNKFKSVNETHLWINYIWYY